MNPLAAETAIVDRLRGAIVGITIGSAANFVGSLSLAQLTPAILVMPGPTHPDDDTDDGAFVETQHWQVDVVVLSTPDHANYNTNFQPAGALIGQVIDALTGFTPGATYQPLRYAGGGGPELVDNAPGEVHFPIDFVCSYAHQSAVAA